MEPGTFEYY